MALHTLRGHFQRRYPIPHRLNHMTGCLPLGPERPDSTMAASWVHCQAEAALTQNLNPNGLSDSELGWSSAHQAPIAHRGRGQMWTSHPRTTDSSRKPTDPRLLGCLTPCFPRLGRCWFQRRRVGMTLVLRNERGVSLLD